MSKKTAVKEPLPELTDTQELMESTDKPFEYTKYADRFEEGWTDFVLSHLIDGKEIHDGIPTCDGLRKAFELLIGPIITAHTTVIKVPTQADPSSTVHHEITYRDDMLDIQRTISDAIDVNQENTKFPWHLASVGTASTKAEGRALRKGLRLTKILTVEEAAQGFDSVETSSENGKKIAGSGIMMAIRKVSDRKGVNLIKLIGSVIDGGKEPNELTGDEAQEVLSRLNDFSEKNPVPEELQMGVEGII